MNTPERKPADFLPYFSRPHTPSTCPFCIAEAHKPKERKVALEVKAIDGVPQPKGTHMYLSEAALNKITQAIKEQRDGE